ncbi:methyltransferase domain-containing protein [Larkinella terrae]|uniref:Methyltransferase domain-containing protein n=1 Tax=Larkinella terrae TaxID=2025311 RepID=A0A7K0EIU5_9BACT|nr:methyltransferase domain-containing protein [Larkinella terrae]MRS61675.1 methyltransferase domain-containing protein [Larkinella terrae]
MSSTNFSFDTIQSFDDHIELSIPNYVNLRESVLRVATHFIGENALVYDLGCSTGLLLAKVRLIAPESARLVGIDRSDNLLGKSGSQGVTLINDDLTRADFSLESCELVFCLFTLQFLPLAARKTLIEKVHSALKPGAALIIAEKQYVDNGYIQDLFTFSHYDMKLEHFTAEQILDKQLSLRRIMRPQSEEQNLALLKVFGCVTPIWQFLQFKAWLCIK